MTRKRYSTEFKREAARMLIIEGVPVTELSEQLEVHRAMLYRWKEQFLAEQECIDASGTTNLKALEQENARLRKELAKSQTINEILKKTQDHFSKDA